jgi:hypothetical protein
VPFLIIVYLIYPFCATHLAPLRRPDSTGHMLPPLLPRKSTINNFTDGLTNNTDNGMGLFAARYGRLPADGKAGTPLYGAI